jgi:hypothetical protein
MKRSVFPSLETWFVSYTLLTNFLFFLLSLAIDEMLGPILGYEQQSLPSLIVSLVGLVFAGVLMDKYQVRRLKIRG